MIARHVAIADAVHAAFPRATHLVGGPTAAFPEEESRLFSHWDAVMRPFIDQAGPHVDYLSIHLYDTYGNAMDTDPQNFTDRTGSNVDAILDLHEAYATATLGRVLPHSVSEYGSGFKTKGFGYRPAHDWMILRGVAGKLMQLLARPDRMLKAVPFVCTKATWLSYADNASYPWVLWRDLNHTGTGPSRPATAVWAPTHLWKFYALWANVTGHRVRAASSDANVQVNAYLDGAGVARICINNLRRDKANVTLDLAAFGVGAGAGAGAGVVWHRARLYWDSDAGAPALQVQPEVAGPLPRLIVLLPNEATILSAQGLGFPRDGPPTLVERTAYSNRTVINITAGEPQDFAVPAPAGEYAYAAIRLGFSQSTAEPVVLQLAVNGVACNVNPATQIAGRLERSPSTGERFASIVVPVPPGVLGTLALVPGATAVTVTATFGPGTTGVGFISSVAMVYALSG